MMSACAGRGGRCLLGDENWRKKCPMHKNDAIPLEHVMSNDVTCSRLRGRSRVIEEFTAANRVVLPAHDSVLARSCANQVRSNHLAFHRQVAGYPATGTLTFASPGLAPTMVAVAPRLLRDRNS